MHHRHSRATLAGAAVLALITATAAIDLSPAAAGPPSTGSQGIPPYPSSSGLVAEEHGERPPHEWPSRAQAAPRAAAASTKDDQIDGLAPSLQDDAGGRSTGTERAASAGDDEGTIRVTVEAASAAAGRNALEGVGATNLIIGGDLVEADVDPSRLVDLTRADGVRLVREPRLPTTFVESEGVNTTDADVWHDAGITGLGATVAVIDAGFEDWTTKLGNELPVVVDTDLSRCDDALASPHGTAVAEIVHDMAPSAELRLVCIDTDTEIINALDTLPAAVDVVNISLGWTLLDRGDGSGPIAAAVDRARGRGVLVVVSAGNYGGAEVDFGTHRHHNAIGDTPGVSLGDLVNMPSGDDGLAFLVAGQSTAFISLQWDAWPNTAQDFDLYIEDDGGNIVEGSERVQNGSGGNDPPIEGTFVTNTSVDDRIYWVLVNRYSGTATPRMDVFFDGAVLGVEAPTGSSIGDPAVAHGALAVGAHCFIDGTPEWFSSVGPTIDGRVKPDVIAPDGTSSSVYGAADACQSNGFFGTSAAAPHAAGAAALLLEENPDLDVAELHRLIERHALDDASDDGRDNIFGAGRLDAGEAGDAYLPPPQSFTPMAPARLFDSRPGTTYPGELPDRTTPIGPDDVIGVRVRGIAGVPADAVAVALNVTAVSPTADGWVTVYPIGQPPNTSNINFLKGQTAAAHVTATVNDFDNIVLYNARGSTHLIVDIAGWYGPTGNGGPSTDRLTPLPSPARAMDTRPIVALGYAETGPGRTTPVGPGETLSVQVAGLGGVPSDATAVMANLTGISPTVGTFISAFPGGGSIPASSNLNLKTGQIAANVVVVPVGAGGVVSFWNQQGNVHLAIDVVGYFKANTGAGYVALDPPTRNLDTRTGTGLRRSALGGNATFNLKVARLNSVPADAAAAMLSVVAVSPTASGWLTLYPGGTSLPNASNVNFTPGAVVANAALARFGAPGTVAFYNSSGSTHIVSDLAGYFIDPANVQLPPP